MLIVTTIELPFIFHNKLKWHYSMTILLLFTLWGLLSMLWALDIEVAINRFLSLIVLDLFYITAFNIISAKERNTDLITTIIIIAGLIMSLYVLCYYGFNNYMTMLINGQRVGTDITNVNYIGLNALMATCCCIYRLVKDKKWYYLLVSIAPFIVSFGSGSRKVIIAYAIMLGSLLLFQKSKSVPDFIRKHAKILIAIIIIIAILQLPFASVIKERLNEFLNLFNESQVADGSTLERKRLIELGIDIWRNNAVGGIGLNGTLSPSLGIGTYLHNNYIELLATLGIVGFLIHYSLYLVAIIKSIQKKERDITRTFILMLIAIFLFYGIASVNYYNLQTYILFILIFTYINNKKKEANESKV